jgi:hypothetical protein
MGRESFSKDCYRHGEMILIQKALKSDAKELRSAAISAFLDDAHGGPPGHDAIENHVNWIRQHDYFKCVASGDIVGGCIVKKHPNYLELFGLFLHSKFIGKGKGSEFLCGVMKLYPDGATWTLETPDFAERNHRFYERNGFIEIEKTRPDPTLGYGFVRYQRPGRPEIQDFGGTVSTFCI